jgi:hypothetical protein
MFLLFGKLLAPADAPSLYYAYGNRMLLFGLDHVALNKAVARDLVGEVRSAPRRGGERVNAALEVNPSAGPDAMAAIRTALKHNLQTNLLAAKENCQVLAATGLVNANTPPLEREAIAIRQFGFRPFQVSDVPKFDDAKRIGAELGIRPNGVLVTVTVELEIK